MISTVRYQIRELWYQPHTVLCKSEFTHTGSSLIVREKVAQNRHGEPLFSTKPKPFMSKYLSKFGQVNQPVPCALFGQKCEIWATPCTHVYIEVIYKSTLLPPHLSCVCSCEVQRFKVTI